MCELMKSSSYALDSTLSFMQYLEHFQFLDHLLGLKMKGVGIQVSEDQVLMSFQVYKIVCELMESFKALSTDHDIVCNRS